jgi:uncharacterized protein (TIGR02246 family)
MRKADWLVIAVAAVLAALPVLAHEAGAADDPRPAIEAAVEKWEQAFKAADPAALAALYTTDAWALPPGGEMVEGREAIGAVFREAMNMGVKEFALEIAEVRGGGDWAYEVGKYAGMGEGGKEVDRGKYIAIWKMDDGEWRIHRDIWNSSVAPVPPPAEGGE